MGLTRFTVAGEHPALGVVLGDEVAPLDVTSSPGAGVEVLLGSDPGIDLEALIARASRSSHRWPLEEVSLLAPVPRPAKIFAIGLNYADHVAESGLQAPEVPTVFAKFQNAVCGPHDGIQLPRVSSHLDYEGELAVVVGKRCRHVPRERAQDVIGGYMVLNDVSVRDWQLQSPQWSLAKSFDTHAPTGPWVTPASDIDPDGLRLRTWVNGEIRQDSDTRQLVFDSFDLVSYISQACTLEPGDIIATGTPGGVGFLREPPLYLTAGDDVRVEIEGLGAIVNRVVEEPAYSAHIGSVPLIDSDPAPTP
jgi:2-keto-4-pentenoate hydratase/2-oxohepta-3-ene-1,7-dioic acid hydratase in catechol pathway